MMLRWDEYLSWNLSAKQRHPCAGTRLIGMLFMLRVMGWRWGWSVRAAGKQSDGTGRGKDWKLIKPALVPAPSLNHGPRTVTQVLRSPGSHYWGVSIAVVTWWCGKWERGADEDFVFMCQAWGKGEGAEVRFLVRQLFSAKAPLLWAAAAAWHRKLDWILLPIGSCLLKQTDENEVCSNMHAGNLCQSSGSLQKSHHNIAILWLTVSSTHIQTIQ